MEEMRDKKVEDDLITGVEEIVALVRKTELLCVFTERSEYGFPLKKYNGIPVISRAALTRWLRDVAGGQPLEKITTQLLGKLHNRRKLESMTTQEIKGMRRRFVSWFAPAGTDYQVG